MEEEEDSITEYIFEEVLLILIGILGFIGNLCTLCIFSRLRKRKTFHNLMMMLAIFDTFYILFNLFLFTFPSMIPEYDDSAFYNYLLPVILPLNHIAMTGSIYSKLAITTERYLVVCHPYYLMSHRWKDRIYIIPVILFSVIYNLPKFFEIETTIYHSGPTMESELDNITTNVRKEFVQEMINNSFHEDIIYGIKPTPLRINLNYISIYLIWINFILMCIVPFTVLITLCSLTLKGMKKHLRQQASLKMNLTLAAAYSMERRASEGNIVYSTENTVENSNYYQNTLNQESRSNEISLAKISIWITIGFVACHSIRWIPNIYELIQHTKRNGEFQWPHWIESITHLSHFSTTLNSSINFYIYFFSQLKKSQMKVNFQNTLRELNLINTCLSSKVSDDR